MGKTIAQKIFEAHCVDTVEESVGVLKADRVFCHEISAPMTVNDPAEQKENRAFDGKHAEGTAVCTAEKHGVREFSGTECSGICHPLLPEQRTVIRPGFTVIMGSSRSCTCGAFGALTAGVGTTGLRVGILKSVFIMKAPQTIRIQLYGRMPEGVCAGALSRKITQKLSVSGASGKILEFSGEGVDSMDMASRMALCNTAAETGAVCGICMPDRKTVEYLWEHIKNEFGAKDAALQAYAKWCSDPDAVYEQTLAFNLEELEPVKTGVQTDVPGAGRPCRIYCQLPASHGDRQMKNLNGKVLFLDRSDISSDEIFPEEYRVEPEKTLLKNHCLENLNLPGFRPAEDIAGKSVIISRNNFGCGASREHAVWALESNGIHLAAAESFAPGFRQNMFNCGMAAVTLTPEQVDDIFATFAGTETECRTNLDIMVFTLSNGKTEKYYPFKLSFFDQHLIRAGGWPEYAESKY